MKLACIFIFSFISLASAAQFQDSTRVDSLAAVSVIPDTVSTRFRLAPMLSFDYGKGISTLAGIDKRYEGAAYLLINNKFELVGEYGTAKLAPENAFSNGNYQADGTYYRIGAGIYSQLSPKSKIGLGLRYAEAAFSDQGYIEIESSSGLQDGYYRPFGNPDLQANWWEVVLTSESKFAFQKSKPEAKINHLISLGFQFRMRFLIGYDRQSPIDVFAIPGYGNTLNDQHSAVNLFLKFHPF